MLKKLGLEQINISKGKELLKLTLSFLKYYPVSYHGFFADLASTFSSKWQNNEENILKGSEIRNFFGTTELFLNWSRFYHQILTELSPNQLENVAKILSKNNPRIVILRPVIESVWKSIIEEDNWQPFYDLLCSIS